MVDVVHHAGGSVGKSSKRKLAERLSRSRSSSSPSSSRARSFSRRRRSPSSFSEAHKRKREERLLASAHHEDDERTFHDILDANREKERETFMQSHDEAVKVHDNHFLDDDDDVHNAEGGGGEEGGKDDDAPSSDDSTTDRFSKSKHPDLSRSIYEKLLRYDHSASAALVLKQQLATGKKCRESEARKSAKAACR